MFVSSAWAAASDADGRLVLLRRPIGDVALLDVGAGRAAPLIV